jgi:predicted cupin superfamily sugar epimerase
MRRPASDPRERPSTSCCVPASSPRGIAWTRQGRGIPTRGAPLELSITPGDGLTAATRHRLGIDLAGGERPQIVVPLGDWQAARSLGDWTLVGCTVSPGFRFEGFELAAPGWEPGAAESTD